MKGWMYLTLVLIPLAACQENPSNAGDEENQGPPHRRFPGPPPGQRREYSPNFPGEFPPRGHYPRAPPNYPRGFPKPPGPYEHSVSRYNRVQVPGPEREYENNNGLQEETDEANYETGENVSWRHCYVCSGMFPDRECELYPKYVTKGPGRINCTQDFCTVFVRYTPKKYLLNFDDNGKPTGAVKTLGPNDYEVTSIARECEGSSRGDRCVLDGDDMGLTCYDTCSTSLCNDVIRNPSEDDFVNFRNIRKEEQRIPVDPENPSSMPEQEAEPALKRPNFKQMPSSPRDVEPTNPEPPSVKPDATSSDKMAEPGKAGDRSKKERMGGDKPRRKPSRKSDVIGKEGATGSVISSADNVQFNVFSILSVFGLYGCAQF